MKARPLEWPDNPLLEENSLPGDEDWVLTKPALGREIEGYNSVCSASSGQTIEFYVKPRRRPTRSRFFEWAGAAAEALGEFGGRSPSDGRSPSEAYVSHHDFGPRDRAGRLRLGVSNLGVGADWRDRANVQRFLPTWRDKMPERALGWVM